MYARPPLLLDELEDPPELELPPFDGGLFGCVLTVVAVETELPVEGMTVVAVETELPVEGMTVVAVETELPVEGVTVVAVETELPVEGVTVEAVETELAVEGVTVEAVETELAVDGVTIEAVDCEFPVLGVALGDGVALDVGAGVGSAKETIGVKTKILIAIYFIIFLFINNAIK